MSKKTKKKAAEKNCVYVCDCCGCEIVCTTPSEGPLLCCNQVISCSNIIGKDLVKNLKNQFIISFLTQIEKALKQKRGGENEANTCVQIRFDRDKWKRRPFMPTMWKYHIS